MFFIEMNSTKGDLNDIIETLPFANSDFLIALIGLIYLLIVCYLGPLFMSKRKPYIFLKSFIIPFYNFIQIVANIYIVSWAFDKDFTKSVCTNLCGLKEVSYEYEKNFILLGYFWWIIKISDLLDTLFFIALKKNSHVSFLHVYHHYTTMTVAFIVFKYLRIEQAVIFAFINSIVHVFMYSYYFVTSIGYTPKKCFKIFITVIQLIQFLFVFLLVLKLYSCQSVIKYVMFSIYTLLQSLMYMYLFGNFFLKNYINVKKSFDKKLE